MVRPLLIALLLLGNDVVSMAITTDRADYARRPDRWAVRNIITGASVIAAPLLTASIGLLWFTRDVWPGLDFDHLRTLSYLTLLASSQATIYLVRTREHAWTSRPSTPLITATAANLAIALTFALIGTLMAPIPWAVALLVLGTLLAGALSADLIKIPVFKALALRRLWRQNRPHVPAQFAELEVVSAPTAIPTAHRPARRSVGAALVDSERRLPGAPR